MSMRYPRKARLYMLLATVSMMCATYFLMLALTGADSAAPWLSNHGGGSGDYGIRALVGIVMGSGAAGVYLVLRAYLRRLEPRPGQEKSTWRYNELSRSEKRRLAATLTLSSSALGMPFAFANTQGGGSGPVFWIFIVAGALGTITGLVMVLIQVRPSRTVMQIVEARMKDERARMARDMDDMRESDARQMERWKDETLSKLYTLVMDQVDKGLITCQKCEELGAAHHSAPEEPQVPEPRCECSGPTSIPVIYFPPRFHSKRTAS